MRGLRLAGLSLVLLLLAVETGAAQARRATSKQTGSPIQALAMDGSRVAYASGGRIHVWNMATGATSAVKGNYGNPKQEAAMEVAIAGKRVAWIKDQQFGNTEEGENLCTASAGGTAHRLKHVYRYGVDDPSLTKGGWIDGLIGTGKHLVVSTWKSDGTTATDRRLSLVTAKGLTPLAGGPGSIVSEAVDSRHVATLSTQPWATASTATVYSLAGEQLGQIHLGTASEIALGGNRLIVLTPSPTPTIEIFDWQTGLLENIWPAAGATTATSGPHQVGHVRASGKLVLYSVYTGYVGGSERLHVLDPDTGKDAVVPRVKGYGNLDEWAVGSRGLVYAIDSGKSGKLEFVPAAKLESLLG